MTPNASPDGPRVALGESAFDPVAGRFKVAVECCDVRNTEKLAKYRGKWKHWMSWYEVGKSQPNSIQSQIQNMLFVDVVYRAITSVRNSADSDTAISARSPTLAYLLDLGYSISQVLALQRLLDPSKGVISLWRLLKDVESHRELITREIYVAGDGLPYDYESWPQMVKDDDPMIQIWGIEAPGLGRFAVSKSLHETFDLLSGKQPDQRSAR